LTKNRILSQARLLQIDDHWIEYLTDPSIVVLRNVFHELKINEAAKLIHEICEYLPTNSVVLLQDMTTLPKAEKRNAGWLGLHLKKIFEAGGIKSNYTPDKSKSGVDVFLLEGQRQAKCEITEKDILKLLIAARREQLNVLKVKYDATESEPANTLLLSRLSHDITVISLELQEFAEETMDESEKYNEQTVASTFSLAFNSLSESDIEELRKDYRYSENKEFQNRSHSLQAIDDFIRSDKAIFLLSGGHFIGKKTVVWQALEKFQHNRLPLFVNLTMGIDIVRIMEEVAFQLGIGSLLDIEVLASLRSLPTKELRSVIGDVVKKLTSETILILDGFENVIDPEGKIDNDDVAWFIDTWSVLLRAKIIIESRVRMMQPPFERCQIEGLSTFKSRSDGRYGKYQYTVQLLQKLVPMGYRLPNIEFGGFPLDLLDALDNHPYFTYVAGTIIRNNPDSTCLNKQDFIMNLKSKLYDNLLSMFGLNDNEKEIMYSFTLIKEPFSLKLIDMATQDSMLTKKLFEKGLLTESLPGRFRPLGIFRYLDNTDKDREKRNQIEQKWHLGFAKIFQRLYDVESDPSLYRQAHYHAALAGDKKQLVAYNLPEISTCADSWYRSRKYDDALWAYSKIQEKRRLHPQEQMRTASCLVRSNKLLEGDKLFENLFKRYKDWHSAKSSYVDSLLSVGGKANKALKILYRIPEENRDYYWHLQGAKCNRQIANRKEAYKEYEDAIIASPKESTWSIIHEFIIYAREVGDNDKEWEWLDYAWNKLKLHFDAVKIDLGSFYERKDELAEAEELLQDAHLKNPSDAYGILPLVKTLCKLDEPEKAKIILDNAPVNASPHELLIYAKLYYFKTKKQFEDAESVLLTLPMDERDNRSIHRWGQWAELFLSWSQTVLDENRITIAKKGLKFVDEIMKERNIPAMMICRELAKIVEDSTVQKSLETAIHEINESYRF
jgi:hypothetical protein